MNVAYVGPFDFPSSSANSLRVEGMVDALVMAGHKVQICTLSSRTNGSVSNYGLGQVEIIYADEYSKGFLSGINAGFRGLFLGDNTLHWLESLEQKPDLIILYGTHLGYLWRLLAFCKRQNIRLLLDVVEWYDPRHLPGGFFGPFAVSNELSMRYFAKKADGMFVISRYLQDHFAALGCKTLRVPPLFPIQKSRPPQFREKNGRLNLCYVGSPGKKEDFLSIFQGLQMAYDAGCKFTMHVVGLTAIQFQQSYGMESLSVLRADGFIQFYGRVDNAEAKKIVASCDFLVILRKNERFVQAGFPSKVAESLCLGTPVIANLMSDLADYLTDGENAIVVSELSACSFASAVSFAAEIEDTKIECMKYNTQISSGAEFYPQNFLSISEFIFKCYSQ